MKLCPSCASVSPDAVLSCPCCPSRFILQISPGDASLIPRLREARASRGAHDHGASLHGPTRSSAGLFRDGATLVMLKRGTLPDRCVRCNAPSTRRVVRKLSWHPPQDFLVLLIGAPYYVLVAAHRRKRAEVSIGLCKEHGLWLIKVHALVLVATVIGVALLLFALFTLEGQPALAGVALLLGAWLGWRFGAQIVRAAKISDDVVWLRGVDPAFLAELPPVR